MEKTFEACNTFIGSIPAPADTTPAEAVELARVCGLLLVQLAEIDLPEENFLEVIAQFQGPPTDVTAYVVGLFVMQSLAAIHMDREGKQQLVEIADLLGPDHLETLRRNVAFMVKVESF